MKKYIVFLIILLFITGCNNQEEKPKGDILDFEVGESMSNYKEYDMYRYHLKINSEYEGKPYNNTIFSFMVDNELGMYLLNYHNITKKDINIDMYKNELYSNGKEYKYYIDDDAVKIMYIIDNDYYLQLSIKSLNGDTSNILELFRYFDFNIDKI